ncbi:MAG: nuclear transport factor 2 family protein [Cryomorphaceae bacterium]
MALIKRTRELKQVAISIVVLFLTFSASCQVDKSDDLYKTIIEKDSLLFDIGFNNCNIEILQDIVSHDFTFFHDQSGITKSKDAFIESVQNGLCKLPYKPIRTLNQGSTYIYPLYNNDTIYGAVQNGEHDFYALEGNNQKYLTSTAKFTHVWVIENGEWKLRSVLSFDHTDVEKQDSKKGLFVDNETTNGWLKQKNIPSVGIGFIDK